MANIWEKAILILAGNLNSGLSCVITTVCCSGKFHYKYLRHLSCPKQFNPIQIQLFASEIKKNFSFEHLKCFLSPRDISFLAVSDDAYVD